MRPTLLPTLLLLTLVLPPLHAAAALLAPLVLGADEDAEVFLLRPTQVEEGPDGDLYVLDAGDARIKVFAPDGTFLRALAGEGEGPGYFQRVDGASFGFTPDGRLFFTEFLRGHRWITTMARDGTDVRTLSPRLDAEFGVSRAVALAGGGFLVQLALSSTPRPEGDHFLYDVPRSLVRLDAEGEIVSRLVETVHAGLISYSPNGGTSTLPVTPAFAWCALDDGRVAWSDGGDSIVQVFDSAGRRVGGIETPLPGPRPVTREDLQGWQAMRREFLLERNPQWWQRFGRVIEEYDESLHDRPALERIDRTPAGNLLVEGAREDDGARYWLLDRDGARLSDVVVGVGDLRISATYLLYFTRGEDGETLVNALRRPADEAEAMAALAAEEGGG